MVRLLTSQEIEEELEQAFSSAQTTHLVKILGPLHQMEMERVADTRALRQGLTTLAEAQARTEAAVERLAEAQARTEERLERLEAAVERLAEAQARTEERLQELAMAVADLRGWQLELRYQERAGAYFGPLLRRLRVLAPHELEDDLEAQLSAAEFEDLLQLDLLVSGHPRRQPEAPRVWLAVEASAVIDRNDVDRAQRRGALLRRAGYRAIPTVAGERITAGAEEAARAGHVLVVQDGRSQFWEEALTDALAD